MSHGRNHDAGVIDVRLVDKATTQQAWSMCLDGVFATEEVGA